MVSISNKPENPEYSSAVIPFFYSVLFYKAANVWGLVPGISLYTGVTGCVRWVPDLKNWHVHTAVFKIDN